MYYLNIMHLSLVLPCFNEEENIEATVRSCSEWFKKDGIDGEIIVVNDGSSDGSEKILSGLKSDMSELVVINHEANKGYGAAVKSGCDKANKDLIAFMDSDGQFDPSDFSKLLTKISKYDFVAGWREKRADRAVRTLNAKLFNVVVRVFLGVRVKDLNCAMKVFKKSIWKKIRPTHSTGALFNAEVLFALKYYKIPFAQVPVPHYPRLHGQQTGNNPFVVLRAFKELWKMRRKYKNT